MKNMEVLLNSKVIEIERILYDNIRSYKIDEIIEDEDNIIIRLYEDLSEREEENLYMALSDAGYKEGGYGFMCDYQRFSFVLETETEWDMFFIHIEV